MKKVVDVMVFYLFLATWGYFFLQNALVGPFARVFVTPISTAYSITAVAYLTVGLVLSYRLGAKSLPYLMVAAGFQEGTWNVAYTLLHPTFISEAVRANSSWPLYFAGLMVIAITVFLRFRKLFRFSLWGFSAFSVFFAAYIIVGMPTTAAGGAWGSAWEGMYVLVVLVHVCILSNVQLRGILPH